MEEKKPLYSIGHGARKAEDFVALLQQYHIDYLVDVRSQPYSRFHPQFKRETLQKTLEANGIQYVYMGDALGGRPKDPAFRDENGRIDHRKIAQHDLFQKGITRLVNAYEKNVALAFMCSERNPAHCHRTRLIGIVLDAAGIPIQHIDEKGQLKTQQQVMREIEPGKNDKDLFD